MQNLFEKAEKARSLSQFEPARKIYRSLLRSPLSKEEKADVLLGLADVERIRGYFPEALSHYRKASQLFETIDPTAQLDAQVGWALSARASGQPWAALKELKKALIQYQKLRDIQGEAFTRWALGGTWRIAGDMKKGLKELLYALRLFKKIKNSEGVSYTCCALGGIYRMLGQYDLSGHYYREANKRMRQRKDTFGIAYSYCGLGNVERMAGRFKRALPFYQKAEKLYGTIGDRVSYAYTLWSLGTTHKLLDQYLQAHQAFNAADMLFKITGDTRGRIYVLLGHAEIDFIQGKSAQGLKWWKEAKKLSDQSHYLWEKLHVASLKNGDVHNLKRQYQKAGSRFYPASLPINWP
ncbi:MAG TPA: tetratricopeptide repeat protein [bacterium]|nr:tetratricopeptide repeat protein [bacterium]